MGDQHTQRIQQAGEHAHPDKRKKGHDKTPVNNCSLGWQSTLIQSTVVHSKPATHARFDVNNERLLECCADFAMQSHARLKPLQPRAEQKLQTRHALMDAARSLM